MGKKIVLHCNAIRVRFEDATDLPHPKTDDEANLRVFAEAAMKVDSRITGFEIVEEVWEPPSVREPCFFYPEDAEAD